MLKNPFRSGWGPGKDVCVDQTNNDRLVSDEIAGALQSIGGTIDVLGFDACLMAMIENAYEIRGKVAFMAGSEETEPGDGWAYDLILPSLSANPAMSGGELSALLVEKYQQYYGAISGSDQTFSAVDLSKLGGVVSAVNALAQAIMGANAWSQVDQARQASDSYNERQHIDLYDFANRLEGTVAAVSFQAAALKSALTDFIIANYAEPSHAGARGVAVYFPPSSGYDPRYANGVLGIDFTADTQWDEMIQASYTGGGGSGTADPYEPNDTYAQAYGPVTSGFTYDGYVTSRSDVDIYKIVAGSTFDLRVDLTVPADYDIYLVRKSGGQYFLVDSSLNSNVLPEVIERSSLSSGEYYVAVFYPFNDDNYSPNPYHLTMTQSGGSGVVDVVLQYDDDSPGFGVYSNRTDINEGVACYFVPPVTPALLKGFAYNFISLDGTPGLGGIRRFVLRVRLRLLRTDPPRHGEVCGTRRDGMELRGPERGQYRAVRRFLRGHAVGPLEFADDRMGYECHERAQSPVYRLRRIPGLVSLDGDVLCPSSYQLRERGHGRDRRCGPRARTLFAFAELSESVQPDDADRIRHPLRGARDAHHP